MDHRRSDWRADIAPTRCRLFTDADRDAARLNAQAKETADAIVPGTG
ncbi:hypothetical protein [Streptomyces abikoensis]